MPEGMDLDAILCKKTEHPLRNDFTIVHDKNLYQILDKGLGRKVMVEERISGVMSITYKGRQLKYKRITARLQKEKPSFKPRRIISPHMEYPWKRTSYDRMILEKAHLQTKKASEELILTEA